jgi:hypothetical protein
MAASSPAAQPVAEFNTAYLPKGGEDIARLIVKAFADAGFGAPQQLAALANAIAESNLNPNAMATAPDKSVGLFQLNTTAGFGKGHTAAELMDPVANINIMLSEAQKSDDFAKAPSLEDAVSVFVRKLMRPADPAGQIASRLKIAERLKPTA